MRNVNSGWALRYVHSNGASLFFFAVYCPHLPRALLRLVQDPARDHLDHRHADLPPDDGDRVHGLRAALGADVVLGRHGDHRALQRHPLRRPVDPDLAARRAGGRQRDADPLLLAALPPAVRDRRAGHPARLGVPHHRQQQPDRRRGAADLEGRGGEGHAAVLALLRDQGPVRAPVRADDLRGDRRLHAELPRAPRQLHRGGPAGDPGAHRARVVLPAVLRDAARDHLRHPLDQLEARRRAGDVRLARGAAAAAVARHQPGALGPLPADVQDLVLAARRRLRDADVVRLAAAGAAVRDHEPARHALLVRCSSW